MSQSDGPWPASQNPDDIASFGQIVLVLQGGGALGAYQAGVYEALHEQGIEPDWVIGTSIGAINASLIAGNRPEQRLEKLHAFWKRVEQKGGFEPLTAAFPGLAHSLLNFSIMTKGVADFFKPNPFALLGSDIRLQPEQVGFYSTKPLEATLNSLVDFSLIEASKPRLTVGAANVRTAEMVYFDSRDIVLSAQHIMASGALPPAFPAVRIGNDLYWDGGILSNTPLEAVFDDRPRRNSLIFAVNIWNPDGPEPETINQALNRQKDVQFCSRAVTHITRQEQIHQLRHIVAELAALLPQEMKDSPKVREMASYGCKTRMHVVSLVAPQLKGEDHTKDIDFSPAGIKGRWQAGLGNTRRVLREAPWRADEDPVIGLYHHECRSEPRTKG